MNLLIVEDNPMTLTNLNLLLQGERGIDRIETFANAEDAISKASWKDTDVLLSDIDLPGMSGVDLIAWTHLHYPDTTNMVYTIHENRDTVFAAIKAGACGYLLKSSSPRELIESLTELSEGGAPMSPKIARKVIMDMQQHISTEEPNHEHHLTSREHEILQQIELGLSYKEIAAKLHISPHTVHTHIKKIYEKVQVGGRDEVVKKARRLGWI
ncbi:MAG: response regulator transcription factor [Kiritimatiellaceae bacterium]|nr:response regulator transcription factor [Kiritimatiellaceae bacterium]